MTEPTFSVNVELTNPGHFFACCGLLELAGRLWTSAEGWFDTRNSQFLLSAESHDDDMRILLQRLARCPITGLTPDEQVERQSLDEKRRSLRKEKKELSESEENRRMELGVRARKGDVTIGLPFHLTLNWWQTESDDDVTPKTWAGLQEIHKVARAAQDAMIRIEDSEALLEFNCVLRTPREYRKEKTESAESAKPVEPFYFDARRFAHALDTGWSLDTQDAETVAYPAVELLALIGIQRFRPLPVEFTRSFEYSAWSAPLPATVASAVTSGAVSFSSIERFRFDLRFRDDQKRYKAFGFATRIGGG